MKRVHFNQTNDYKKTTAYKTNPDFVPLSKL